MPISARVDGAHKVGTPSVKVGGVWKAVDKIFINAAGVWKEGYAGTPVALVAIENTTGYIIDMATGNYTTFALAFNVTTTNYGFCIDKKNQIIISNYNNGYCYVYNFSGQLLRQVHGVPTGAFAPQSLYSDGDNLFVANTRYLAKYRIADNTILFRDALIVPTRSNIASLFSTSDPAMPLGSACAIDDGDGGSTGQLRTINKSNGAVISSSVWLIGSALSDQRNVSTRMEHGYALRVDSNGYRGERIYINPASTVVFPVTSQSYTMWSTTPVSTLNYDGFLHWSANGLAMSFFPKGSATISHTINLASPYTTYGSPTLAVGDAKLDYFYLLYGDRYLIKHDINGNQAYIKDLGKVMRSILGIPSI